MNLTNVMNEYKETNGKPRERSKIMKMTMIKKVVVVRREHITDRTR